MVTFDINLTDLAILLAIVVRIGVVLFMLPIFNTRSVPASFKALIVVSFSVMLFPVVRQNIQPIPFEPAALASVVVGELVFGVFFSLSILLVMAGFDLAGQLVDFEMGFGFAQTAAPQTRANTTVLSAFTQLLAFMIFLSVNGHLLVIQILVHSFKTIPVGSFALSAGLFRRMIMLSGMLFVLAVKLASPVLAVLILTQAAMGLMTKFAPQVNIFSTSFPLTITLGMLFLGLTLICWGEVGSQAFARLFDFLRFSTQ